MGKTVYNPRTLCRPFGIFSNAALADPGRHYFISGQVAIDAEGHLVGRGTSGCRPARCSTISKPPWSPWAAPWRILPASTSSW